MKHGLPTQIVWERTLRGKNVKQDPATMAWNLFLLQSIKKLTTSRGSWKPFPRPHALSGFPSSARTHPSPRSKPVLRKHFREGVSLVLQGPRTITDRKGNPVPHLSEKEAEVLLTNVLKLFSDYHDTKPRRVVVHKTSKYWPEELGGFRKASSTPPATFPPYQPIPECACPCQSRSLNTMGTPPLTWFARKSLP
jgi:hypothetical protein